VALLDRLPPIWPDGTLREWIARRNAQTGQCVVVLDDDPTGCQTVHDAWVLTRWDVPDLRRALAEADPLFFILTNTRSMSLAEAQALNREVAANLVLAAQAERRPFTVVSRSDSTLRGHYPGEVHALGATLVRALGADFDGTCIIPFFPEGGRFTIGDIHWVQEGDTLVPAAQTAYAQDPVFGYGHSSLPGWVEEKTGGQIRASDVVSISLDLLRCGGPSEVAGRLQACPPGGVVVVNAAHYRDLEVFVVGLQSAMDAGKRFLFRTAASFVKALAGLADRPLLSAQEMAAGRPNAGGLIAFGSYVPKSTAQLAVARQLSQVAAVELPVEPVLDDARRDRTVSRVAAALDEALEGGGDALVYTSREVYDSGGLAGSLKVGHSVSLALVEIVRRLVHEPRYVIAKGGITASDIATQGLDVGAARILGQVLPGVPVWRLGPGSRWPGVPYVVFPGNVGEDDAVASVIRLLRTP
jgi:uncharacterized protein YgbK (DUF1537 family)